MMGAEVMMTVPNLIMDRTHKPIMEEISAFLSPNAAVLWNMLIEDAQARYKARCELFYSICSGKPGWNVKLRAKGKALCTLYPDPDFFTVLIVLNMDVCEAFELLRAEFSAATQALYERTACMNGTKWLMVVVADEPSLREVQRLLRLKTQR